MHDLLRSAKQEIESLWSNVPELPKTAVDNKRKG